MSAILALIAKKAGGALLDRVRANGSAPRYAPAPPPPPPRKSNALPIVLTAATLAAAAYFIFSDD